jgi:2-haloacid dehalogenase
MSDLSRAPAAVLFDAYGTLFDVYSVGALAERLFPGHGAALAGLWRDKQIEYTRLRSMSGNGTQHYAPFSQVTRDALRYACQRLHLALPAASEQALMAAYDQLTPFAENLGVLQALKARGVTTGILSNGSPDMLAAAVASAGFGEVLDHVISVDAVRRFKTAPEAYALGPQATGVAAADTLFVSSNGWDAAAAAWFGYRVLWVNRQNAPLEELGVAPERVGRSLADVMAFF